MERNAGHAMMHNAALASQAAAREDVVDVANVFTGGLARSKLSEAHALQEQERLASNEEEKRKLHEQAARLLEAGYALKLQSHWRCHAARRNADALRATSKNMKVRQHQ